MGIKDWIIDKYLTWKTGMDAQEREWRKWQDENIAFRSDTVQGMFYLFKHVIEVDYRNFFDHEEMGAWIPVDDWKPYAYPQRKLGENCVWIWARGEWGGWDWNKHQFLINEMFGGDHVFIATNSDEDALMLSLRFS